MSRDRETISVYDAKADDYAAMTASNAHDTALSNFIKHLPKGGAVLDLGCGPGVAAAVMADQGLRVTAIDASSKMVALAARHPDVDAREGTFEDIEGQDIYDGIWANFSLLHAPRADMPRYLADLSRALKRDGVFHIGLKTGEGQRRDGIGRLYTYYTKPELRALLEAAGLTVFAEREGNDIGLDGEMAAWVTLLARA